MAGGPSLTEQFAQESPATTPGRPTDPIRMAREVVASGGEVNATAAAGLSELNFKTFEQRLGRIVLENAELAGRMMDQIQAGTSRHDSAESMRRFLDSPQGQTRMQDPAIREALITFAGATDKEAAREVANTAIEKSLGEWDLKLPGIMQKIDDARPDQQAAMTVRPAGMGLG